MAKVLVIYSSVIGGPETGSFSSGVTNHFVNEYKAKNPSDEIISMDLNKEEVGLKVLTSANRASGFFDDGLTDTHVNLLKSVDKVVIAASMTNFSYPAVLKNYLDHILVAGKSFNYKYNGKGASEGLLSNKVALILSQGAPLGWYEFSNHHISLKGALEFAGMNVVDTILIEGTKTSENADKTAADYVERHKSDITSLVNKF